MPAAPLVHPAPSLALATRPLPAAVPTGPGYDVVLLLHVAAVVVALASVVVSGVQSARLLAAAGDGGGGGDLPAGIVTYYAPGANWVGRTVHAVPLLGLVLVGLSHGAYGFEDAWIQSGVGLWVVAAAGAEAVLWPAERRIQAALDGAGGPASARRSCRTVLLAVGAVVAVLVAAIVVMVAKP